MTIFQRWHRKTACRPEPLLCALLCLTLTICSVTGTSNPFFCRSSDLEIQWTAKRSVSQEQRKTLRQVCSSQSLQDAKKDAWNFLRNHVMEFDQPKLNTLGFGDNHTEAPDGLDQGLIGPTIDLALQAKIQYPWTDALPQAIFYEYVLNYANLNEARNNWRPLLWDILNPLLEENKTSLTPNDVVRLVNQKLWSSFPGPNTIYFKHGLTPLIFDPMSVIAFGYASCTGLAVFFVNALRTAGIAARVVGTPAWNSDPSKGNHNWLEVYSNDDWVFLEPSPNLTHVDDLTTKPCSKWFCEPSRFPQDNKNETNVYSARLVSSSPKIFYPMAWESECYDVPAEDRTDYYHQVCSQC